MAVPSYARSTISSRLKTRQPYFTAYTSQLSSGRQKAFLKLGTNSHSMPTSFTKSFGTALQHGLHSVPAACMDFLTLFDALGNKIAGVTMKRVTCTTCDRDLPSNQFPKTPDDSKCDHDRETCKRCWHQWLASQVDSKSYDQISCAQCTTILGQNEIRLLATPAVYEKYLDAEFKATMSADLNFRWCIASGCTSGQIHSEGDIFRCVSCGHKACVNCNVAWHAGETCEAFQSRLRMQPNEEEESAKALKKYSKICPGCNRKVQKNGGCDHIHC